MNALEQDDYGFRLSGGHTLWVARVVIGPVEVESRHLRHFGALSARAVHSRSLGFAALAALRESPMVGYHRDVGDDLWWIVEPGFYSKHSMPGAFRYFGKLFGETAWRRLSADSGEYEEEDNVK